MDLGIVFGLAAALCWGVTDIFARGASRSGGTFRTLLVVQIVAAPAMLVFGLASGLLQLAPLAVAPLWAILLTLAIGLVINGGAGILYHAFAVGSISLISPIAASYSAITTLLALTLSGEHPTAPQLVGIVVTLVGVALTSAVPGHPSADTSHHVRVGPVRLAPGLFEALISVLIFGGAYWALRFVVPVLGGYSVTFVQKVGDLAGMLLLTGTLLLLRRTRRGKVTAMARTKSDAHARVSPRFLIFVVPMALLDTAANIAYNLGIAVSLTSIVSVLSSLFSPITVVLAWLFLGERLYRWQWAGVLAIFAGVALVSV